MLREFVSRFVHDRKGNVAIIFALSLIPCVFLIGMGIDFGSAMEKRIWLNAATDAAALAAVTPAMMNQSAATATTAAQNLFNAQASTLSGLSYSTPTVTITNTALARTVTVSYTAYSINSFPNVLGLLTGSPKETWTITGSSQATSSTAPNIDFYLLLDNSPSMAIAATISGHRQDGFQYFRTGRLRIRVS